MRHIKRVLMMTYDAAHKKLVRGDEYEIHGTNIEYEPTYGDKWDEWEPILDDILRRLDELDWLDGLNKIEIGRDYIRYMETPSGYDGPVNAQYRPRRSTATIDDTKTPFGQPFSVTNTREYVIYHELAHHAHMNELYGDPSNATRNKLKQYNNRLGPSKSMASEVSTIAKSSNLEFVGEVAAGILVGKEYDDRILNMYHSLDGPKLP